MPGLFSDFWKGFAVAALVVATIIAAGGVYVGILGAGQRSALAAEQAGGDSVKVFFDDPSPLTTVVLKGQESQLVGFYHKSDKTFLVLRSTPGEAADQGTLIIPWSNVLYLHSVEKAKAAKSE